MAKREQIYTGLDVGTTHIRTVIGKVEGDDGRLTVVGMGEAPSSGIRKGVIVDVEEAVKSISNALDQAERMTGYSIDKAVVSVGGAHVVSLDSHGVVAVGRADGEVTEDDVARAISASQAISVPNNKEILHVIPKSFTVDGQTGIKDPVGMSGVRLEVDSNIIEGSVPFIKNLTKCVGQSGIEVDDLVLAPLAAAQAVLTKRQKELGVALLDIGGGTTGLIVFEEGELLHSAILPIGSGHITNDLAIGLRTSIDVAERVKVEYGFANPDEVSTRDEIDLSAIDPTEEATISRHHVAEIIQARLQEIFSMVDSELEKIDRAGNLPAGVVLSGGGAKLPGIIDEAKAGLRLPVQIGFPTNVAGLVDKVDDPAYATSIGLLIWATEFLGTDKGSGGISITRKMLSTQSVESLRKWLKKFLP